MPLAILPRAVVDAPLGRLASVSVRLRFAIEGDVGAGGSDGGVRAPLATAMVMAAAVRDWERWRADVQRAQGGSRIWSAAATSRLPARCKRGAGQG